MVDFKVGDLVLLVDKESPEKRRERLGKKKKNKKHTRSQRVAFFDTIDTIENNKPITKKHRFKAQNKNGNSEDSSDAVAREERGEPQRRIYFARREWFQFPNGMQANIESIDIDEYVLNNVILPFDKQIRES